MILVDEYAPAQLDEFLSDLLSERHSPGCAGVDVANVSGAALALTEWACTNCLREFTEPFCAECGANLMEVKR